MWLNVVETNRQSWLQAILDELTKLFNVRSLLSVLAKSTLALCVNALCAVYSTIQTNSPANYSYIVAQCTSCKVIAKKENFKTTWRKCSHKFVDNE